MLKHLFIYLLRVVTLCRLVVRPIHKQLNSADPATAAGGRALALQSAVAVRQSGVLQQLDKSLVWLSAEMHKAAQEAQRKVRIRSMPVIQSLVSHCSVKGPGFVSLTQLPQTP
jgi:hypothetical protein